MQPSPDQESTEQIVALFDQIFENLNLEYEVDDLNLNIVLRLFHEHLYIEMYKIMFPFLQQDIMDIQNQSGSSGQKIQQLIDLLSSSVLTMDLSHISGNAIAEKDKKHLYNFLQLLFELSRLYKTQNENTQENQQKSTPSQKEMGQENNYEMGMEDDFEDGMEEDYLQSWNKKNYEEQEQKNRVVKISEVSKESSNKKNKNHYEEDDGEKEKQIHRSKSQKDLAQEEIPNNKQNQIKALEDNIMPVTQKQHRIMTVDPNIGTKKPKQGKSQNVEMAIPEYPNDLSEIDMTFLENIDPEEVAKLPPDHEVAQKYQRELEKLQLLEQLQQLYSQEQAGENMDELIEAQIKNIKESLKAMRENRVGVDEQDTNVQIVKNRNNYKQFLKDYLKEYKKKQNESDKGKNKQIVSSQYQMKMLQQQKKDLKKEFENQQKSMYCKMRDEKLNYLRKIKRIIFELEKRKIIDEKKEHLQMRRQQNIATRNALTSIENAYNDRINMLKEKLRNERKERHVASVAQKQVNILNRFEQVREGTQVGEDETDR